MKTQSRTTVIAAHNPPEDTREQVCIYEYETFADETEGGGVREMNAGGAGVVL